MTASPTPAAAPGLAVHLAEPPMLYRRPSLIATGILVCLATLVGTAHAGQPTTTTREDDTDGLFRTELTLSSRQISVAYDPGLRADDAVQAVLLTAPSVSTESGVLVARLTGPRTLRLARLGPDAEPKVAPASGLKHDLWLTRTPEGWALDARPVEEPEPEPESEPEPEPEADPESERDADAEADTDEDEDEDEPKPEIHAESGRIPLRHDETQAVVDTLSVVLEPTGDDTGHLMLRWGTHLWTTDFEFVELPRRPRPERPPGPPRGSSLTRDSDTSGRARAATLGTRNETALWTLDGAHIQVLFQKEIGTDGDDYAGIETTADGDVVQLTQAAVIRLRTEVSLRFGQTLVPTGNLAPDFPGAYGLWLKKAGTDWRLVFNDEPDSWGSQHDPAFDAIEIDLSHARVDGAEPDRPLAVYLEPLGVGENRLIIHWGPHVWTADFSVVR